MTQRPNIVLIMTDQHRADFMRRDGFPLDTMPFLDSVGEDGVVFDRGYTVLPACVPARCSLLTGRFPKATGVRENHAAAYVSRDDDLIDVLSRSGYQTVFSGKTHFYRKPEDFDRFAGPYFHTRGPAGRGTPEQHGFEEWLTDLDHGVADRPSPYGTTAQFPHRIVSDAIEALSTLDHTDPFFCWVSFPEPHNPYQVPDPYFDMFPPEDVPERRCGPEAAAVKGPAYEWLLDEMRRKRPGYDEEWRQYRSNYCGMLRLLDDQIRRLLDHLDRQDQLENTIVWFVSDHGDYAGDYGLQRKGAGMPECLMRVPFQVTGPGIDAGRNSADFVSLVDLFPTVCEMVGAEIPAGVQGRSLWPMLTGRDCPGEEFSSIYAECGIGGVPYDADERPEMDTAREYDYAGRSILELNSVTQSGNIKMLRRGDWKLLHDSTGHGEMFNVADDPAELHDRYADPDVSGIRHQLTSELLTWSIRTDDPLPLAVYQPKRHPHNWWRAPAADGRQALTTQKGQP